MKLFNLITLVLLNFVISSCGKVGPLTLPEDKVDKSLISYPCDEACQKQFEEEKKRQKSVILQTD